MLLQRSKHLMKPSLATMLLGLLTFAQAEAVTIVGGSTLLDAAGAKQLESWLGEGAITLTNIYAKAAGDTSVNFHSAVDGKGPTFAMMSATEGGSGINAIIGGYNPQSWRSNGGFNFTPFDADRTGFIFNLSTDSLFRQNLGINNNGQFQTFNASDFGPTFGGGYDIYVNAGMDVGSSYLWSYSDGRPLTTSIIDGSVNDGTDVRYGAMEVFTIAPTAPVPEPETYAMLLAGIGFVVFAARRRKNLAVQ
jgi:TLD/PEP-CTERM motif